MLKVASSRDLVRHVVLSDLATVQIHALELSMQLTGRYTTV